MRGGRIGLVAIFAVWVGCADAISGSCKPLPCPAPGFDVKTCTCRSGGVPPNAIAGSTASTVEAGSASTAGVTGSAGTNVPAAGSGGASSGVPVIPTGAEQCIAAGGQCLIGSAVSICAELGPFDCNPPPRNPGGAFCCLKQMPMQP